MLKIKRAIISVWSKKGVVEFAKKLKEFNVEILSTGKTSQILRKNGIPCKEISEITGYPTILSGRVKTLHPKIFGAILANKKHPLHLEEIKRLDIEPIDMVVVNFYPFKEALGEDLSFEQQLEYIDIGGPALLRAGAKNFKNVACVSSPSQYQEIIEELENNNGCLSDETLLKLANEVFQITSDYDNTIHSYLKGKEILVWKMEKICDLRYGENPHQKASLFKLMDKENLEFHQLQGKELSFNNLLDLDTCLSLVKEFTEPTAVIVKHCSPCAVALDKKLYRAYVKAYQADTISSFGGIIGVNKKLDKYTAKEIIKSGFKECIVAPCYSKEALKLFSEKKNLRIVEVDINKIIDYKDIKRTDFGYLIQDNDRVDISKTSFKVVTKKKPSQKEWKDMLFAWKVVKFVKSNAIVIAKNLTTLGIGSGQPSRVGAVKIAIENSFKSSKGAVLASDAFFPYEDSIKLIKKAGIKTIIQPGGSIMDEKIIELCNKLDISMVFTGIRHFRH
ncbi:MAG: bifunctional phosphoribosylaminoimidazolecarboxamide formyltransferase/IMP cyclohydrolase [Candidatus Omnitrophica bacterium]|nr:bifunctional phosphoribosylaminoimidazolecarboxamide formyltransferase/IMP cyclohydrolase [Candidatus Omnitrophota bacterium]